MERPIITTGDYTVFEATESALWDLATFVVRENYSHHSGETELSQGIMNEMIYNVYLEECELVSISKVFIAYNNDGEIIGSIRSALWDRKIVLPMEKLFGVNPLNLEFSKEVSKFWHIGRLAISREGTMCSKSILKTLISTVVTPIKKEKTGCLLAEVDKKLYNNLKRFGIYAHQIAPSILYLASETIPIYSRSCDIALDTYAKKYPIYTKLKIIH